MSGAVPIGTFPARLHENSRAETSHLPLRRSFKWRNEQFKDFDEDAETYDDYHTVDGLPTAYTLTRYRNGDMTNQRFYTKVAYNMELPPDLFTQEKLDPKKK